MMKTIAYLRVSTTNQDLDQQRLTILDYAHRHRITVDEFVSVEVSSRKGLKQRDILDLLDTTFSVSRYRYDTVGELT